MAIQSPAGEADSGRPKNHAGQTVDGDVVEGTGMSHMSVRLVYGVLRDVGSSTKEAPLDPPSCSM